MGRDIPSMPMPSGPAMDDVRHDPANGRFTGGLRAPPPMKARHAAVAILLPIILIAAAVTGALAAFAAWSFFG